MAKYLFGSALSTGTGVGEGDKGQKSDHLMQENHSEMDGQVSREI